MVYIPERIIRSFINIWVDAPVVHMDYTSRQLEIEVWDRFLQVFEFRGS